MRFSMPLRRSFWFLGLILVSLVGARDGVAVHGVVASNPQVLTERPTIQLASNVTRYRILFSGFSEAVVDQLVQQLAHLPGYQRHRFKGSSDAGSEFEYASSLSQPMMMGKLHGVLAELGLKGSINFAGNTYRIEKASAKPGFQPGHR